MDRNIGQAATVLTGRDIDINNHAAKVIDGPMLLVERLHTVRMAGRCHRGIRIGGAAFLGFGLFFREPASPFGCVFIGSVFCDDGFGVLGRQTFPTDIGTDERCVNMNGFAID